MRGRDGFMAGNLGRTKKFLEGLLQERWKGLLRYSSKTNTALAYNFLIID